MDRSLVLEATKLTRHHLPQITMFLMLISTSAAILTLIGVSALLTEAGVNISVVRVGAKLRADVIGKVVKEDYKRPRTMDGALEDTQR